MKNVSVDVTYCRYKKIRGDGVNIVRMEITETAFKGTLRPIMWVVWLHKDSKNCDLRECLPGLIWYIMNSNHNNHNEIVINCWCSASYKCKKQFISKMVVKCHDFHIWNAYSSKLLLPDSFNPTSLSLSLYCSLSFCPSPQKWCFIVIKWWHMTHVLYSSICSVAVTSLMISGRAILVCIRTSSLISSTSCSTIVCGWLAAASLISSWIHLHPGLHLRAAERPCRSDTGCACTYHPLY